MSVDIFKGTILQAPSDPKTGFKLPSLSGSSGLGSLLGAGIDLFNAGYGVYQDQRNWKYTKALNEQQQQNYEDQFQFQKDVWEQTKQREDTAISRRVRDMQSAGINPITATGAGAASVGTVSTPSMISPHSNPVHMSNNTFQNAMASAQFKAQLNMQNSQIQLANAETELKLAQAKTEVMKPAMIQAQTDMMASRANLNYETIESMNYQQIEEKIIAEFLKDNPELKKKELEEELKKTGLENELTKTTTKEKKFNMVLNAIRTLVYAVGTGFSIASRGAFASSNPIGFIQ